MIKTAKGWRPLFCPCVNSNMVEGVFSNVSVEEAMATTGARAQLFEDAVENYIAGNLPKERLFDAFNPPVYGAYGDKL